MDSRFSRIDTTIVNGKQVWQFYEQDRATKEDVKVLETTDVQLAEEVFHRKWTLDTIRYYQNRLGILSQRGQRVVKMASDALSALDEAVGIAVTAPNGQMRAQVLDKTRKDLEESLKNDADFRACSG